MTVFSHWHPVALSHELGPRRPHLVRLHGRPVSLFRDGPRVGALDDACPHRGFPLHKGTVEDGCLVCPYHGWSWSTEGQGHSPGTPRARPRTTPWEAVERLGALWIRRSEGPAAFPTVDASGHQPVTTFRVRAHAPLEVVLDNFIEVEHTPSVHAFLGYPKERLADVVCTTTLTDTSVRVYNRGPQRPLPGLVQRLFAVPPGADFVDDWTTRFSPVHTVYAQYFVEPGKDTPHGYALRIAVFFTPVGPRETDLFVFVYTSAGLWARPLLEAVRLPILAALVRLEAGLDARLLGSLSEAPTVLRGRPLGRFDRALLAARRRLATVYRGEAPDPDDPSA